MTLKYCKRFNWLDSRISMFLTWPNLTNCMYCCLVKIKNAENMSLEVNSDNWFVYASAKILLSGI